MSPSSKDELSEFCVDFFAKCVDFICKLLRGLEWVLELKLCQSVVLGIHSFEDHEPSDFALGLQRFINNTFGIVEEAADGLHHSHGLVQWAVIIVIREGILLQEIFSNNFGDLRQN